RGPSPRACRLSTSPPRAPRPRPQEGEIPLERAVRDFSDEVVLARRVVIGFALALDAEHVVHHGHANRLRIHARQGELDDVRAVLEPSLRSGNPRTLGRLVHGAANEPLERAIGDLVKVELTSRRPSKHGVHSALLTYYHLDNLSCTY